MVFNDSLAFARARGRLVAAVLMITTLMPAVADATLDPADAFRASSAFGLVELYLQLLVTSAVLGAHGLVPARYDPRRPTLGRYPAAFGLGLIYFVAVLAGLALLVIPGLLLIARWSVSLPALVSEDVGITEALRRSWRLTARHWPVPALVYAIVTLTHLPTVAIAYLLYPPFGPVPLPTAILVNLLMSLCLVAMWLAIAVIYVRLRAKEAEAA